MAAAADLRTPVVLLTGWLGAGKTTLLNRILAAPAGRRFAVLVNEFGEIGVDQRLVRRVEEDLVELSNGCVCCTVRGDLVAALGRLRRRRLAGLLPRRRFDAVLLETTGVAEPAPLLRTFLVEESIALRYRVATITAVADAAHLDRALAEAAARDQVALADLVLLNKADLTETQALAAAEERLRRLNPLAPIRRCVRAEAPVAEILAERPPRPLPAPPAIGGERHGHGDLETCTLVSEQPLDELRARLWLDACARGLAGELVRWKGFLHLAGRPTAAVLQGTYELYTVEEAGPWPGRPRNEVVFIGRRLDRAALQRGLEAASAESG
ncbi:MAG: GTP-binding protein [Planctomycetota bacterium]|nr:MAG: GTP-binding protein [Planctomycetota bacterium]